MMVWPLEYPVEEAKQVVLKSWPRIDSEAPCKNKSTNVYRYEDLLLQGPAIMQRIVMASSLLLSIFYFIFIVVQCGVYFWPHGIATCLIPLPFLWKCDLDFLDRSP